MRAACVVLVTVMLITDTLRAQEDRREQISAATARAVEGLRMQIAAEPIGRNLTVGDLLNATNGTSTLRKTLCRAQMIGGPRWIDDQTCQVQLEMSGPRVAAALIQIATTHEKKSPIAPQVLTMRLRQWDNRTFSATGTSTGAAAVENVKPVEDGIAWQGVSDEARQQALSAARRNAAVGLIDEIETIPLGGGNTVSDLLADAKMRAAVEEWVTSRPVTQIEFRDDLQVRVTVATPAEELADALRAAAEKNDAGVKLDDAAWSRLRNDFAANVPPTLNGTARAGAGAVHSAMFGLESPPPAWVIEQRSADGVAPVGKSPLKSARIAEADGQAKLRAQVDTLVLPGGMSIGDAARQDARLNDAVDRVISRARPMKVDYQPDGGARVRVTLELRSLWDEITAAR